MIHDLRNQIQKELSQKSLKKFISFAWDKADPSKFIDSWHVDAISDHLEACYRGEIKNLIINIPPRCGKSLIVSVLFPAWVWIKDPSKSFLMASNGMDLVLRDNQRSRMVIQSDWYQKNWGDIVKFASDENQKKRYMNTRGGVRQGVSVGSTTTGYGGDFLIMDDGLDAMFRYNKLRKNTVNDWNDSVFSTRAKNPNSVVRINVGQRLAEDDLAGHLLDSDVNWELLMIPLRFESERKLNNKWFCDLRKNDGELLDKLFTEETAIELEKTLGAADFSGQYQQRPVSQLGGIIERSWIRYYSELPIVKKYFWSWDTAIKTGQDNDYSVGTYWAECDEGYYLVYMFRDKLKFPDLENQVRILYNKYPASEILIEDKASGQQLVQSFQRIGKMPIIAMIPGRNMALDKETRMRFVSPLFESGKVFIPKNDRWVVDFVEEVCNFPGSAHDDIVDSMTQALSRRLDQYNKSPRIRNLR